MYTIYLEHGISEKVKQEVILGLNREFAFNPNLNGADYEILCDDYAWVDGGADQNVTVSLLYLVESIIRNTNS